MANFEVCPICKEYDFVSTHKCAPAWYIENQEYSGDELHKIHAHNHKEAAKKWGEWYDDRGDYEIIGGTNMVITVYGTADRHNKKEFIVSAQPAREYYAKEVSQQKERR